LSSSIGTHAELALGTDSAGELLLLDPVPEGTTEAGSAETPVETVAVAEFWLTLALEVIAVTMARTRKQTELVEFQLFAKGAAQKASVGLRRQTLF